MEFTVEIEAISREALLGRLTEAGVELNKHSETLLAMPAFEQLTAGTFRVCVLSVAELNMGKTEPTLPAIHTRVKELGYRLCPLELAPFFRLAWMDQPNSSNSVLSGQKQAPESSVSVATPVLSEDFNVPKGFYLRVVDGVPWLRGHLCDEEHVFEQSTMFAFLTPEKKGQIQL